MKVAFYTLGLPFHGQTIYQKSLGGSETAMFYMAREFSKLGHDVTVFCDCPKPGMYEGVQYHRHQDLQSMSGFLELDVFFCYRFYHQLSKKIKSNLNILVCHDVLVDSNDFSANMWGCDHVFVLSDYHRRIYTDAIPQLEKSNMVWTTGNGIDLSMTDAFLKTPKQDLVVYGSRPERGLDVLLTKIWPKFFHNHPRFRLALCGYDLGNFPIDANTQAYYRYLADLVVSTQGVEDLGPLSKKDWYELLASAKLMLYPTSFPEIFCINALESQALKTPVVTTKNFALPETVRFDSGLIHGDPATPEYQENFLQVAGELIDNEILYRNAQNIGRQHAVKYQWKDLAKKWENKCFELLEERWGSDSHRVVNNLIYHSDLIAARSLSDDYQLDPKQSVIQKIFNQDITLDDYIESIKRNNQSCYSEDEFQKMMALDIDRIGRFTRICEIADGLKLLPEKFTMLDIGCHYGEFATFMTNRFPQCRITAVDHDPDCIEAAKKLLKKKSKASNHVKFAQSEAIDYKLSLEEEPYDVVFLGEILEHFENPVEILELANTWVKPGGLVICTTPNGPWEGWNNNPRHLHNFDSNDIRSLVGHKPDFTLSFLALGVTHRGDLLGNYIFMYRTDDSSFGAIDYSRKRFFRPYQFVSACLITKNEENNIGRCLSSISPHVDEIIVADTGSTDDTCHIVSKYPQAKVVHVPFDIDGDGLGNFAAWRNAGVKEVYPLSDWIFWIDGDEALNEGQKFHKYLTGSKFFEGFVIHQCHLTLDVERAKPDTPCRIYRNNGRWIFQGVIHEQPMSVDDINMEVNPAYVLPDTQIIHYGYPTERVRRVKVMRNLPMLSKDRHKNPHRELGAVLVMRDLINLANWTMVPNSNGGVSITEQGYQYVLKAIQIFRSEFWGSKEKRKKYWSKYGFELYQHGLEILARNGLSVKEGSPPPIQIALAMAGQVGGLQYDKEQYKAATFWFADFDEMKSFVRERSITLEEILSKTPQLIQSKKEEQTWRGQTWSGSLGNKGENKES